MPDTSGFVDEMGTKRKSAYWTCPRCWFLSHKVHLFPLFIYNDGVIIIILLWGYMIKMFLSRKMYLNYTHQTNAGHSATGHFSCI